MIKYKYLYNIIKNKIIKIKNFAKLYYYGLGLLLYDVFVAEDTRKVWTYEYEEATEKEETMKAIVRKQCEGEARGKINEIR